MALTALELVEEEVDSVSTVVLSTLYCFKAQLFPGASQTKPTRQTRPHWPVPTVS